MHEQQSSAPRKPWVKPEIQSMKNSQAELGGTGGADGTGLS